ncbi:acyltransferase [Hahella sp. SMD15-11]|uniref:Acyltransferase n=1 Tax=Thermohahella caldifontis TaxID=3142973 RepID=A0AB39URP1_9GAMM
MRIMRPIKKILLYLKYRHIHFREVGANVLYKSLKSNFAFANQISIGDNVSIGPGADFDGAGGITIGSGVIFAPGVKIYSRTHYYDGEKLEAIPFDNKVICKEVIIKDYVWIGRDAIILPGVTIGEGAVIGAGSVVSKNVPDGAVVVGNPARVVKYRNIERFNILKSEGKFVYATLGHKKEFVKEPLKNSPNEE